MNIFDHFSSIAFSRPILLDLVITALFCLFFYYDYRITHSVTHHNNLYSTVVILHTEVIADYICATKCLTLTE